MEINDEQNSKIIIIWNEYIATNKQVLDVKGVPIQNIDELRREAIKVLIPLIRNFTDNKLSVTQFKTEIDSFNKQNNLWGFTSIKGQMFFNLLVKVNDSEEKLSSLKNLLINTISFPSTIDDALKRIEKLEGYCKKMFQSALDKRKFPNPSSTGYFLSYFWQIQDHIKWPIMYSSMTSSWKLLGLWNEELDQKYGYHLFYMTNHFIKEFLTQYTGREIQNWDVEHAFWNFSGAQGHGKIQKIRKERTENSAIIKTELQESVTPVELIRSSISLSEYIIPKVARLLELGAASDKPSASKGSEYEKCVVDIFKLLDFDVEALGQGTGRNPDAIVKYRKDNTAFIVDAKAYSSGYSLGLDDRAIREYISYHTNKLKNDGYKKIGFIIVCNSFKSNLSEFISDITWTTDIKRFILLTSEALLYLLAYKTKDNLSIEDIIDSLINIENIITCQDIISRLDEA